MARTPPSGEPAINVSGFFENARTATERNNVLSGFAWLMEHPGGPPRGTFRMFADMAASRNAFRGGAWTLRALETGRHFSLDEVESFEDTTTQTVAGPNGTEIAIRRYDVTLTGGRRLEMKSWTRWFPESIRDQFRRDVLINTRNFRNLAGLTNVPPRHGHQRPADAPESAVVPDNPMSCASGRWRWLRRRDRA